MHLCEHCRQTVPNILQPDPDPSPKSKGWAGAGAGAKEEEGGGSDSRTDVGYGSGSGGGGGTGGTGGGGLSGTAGVRAETGVQRALLPKPVAGTFLVGTRPVLRAELAQRPNTKAPRKALQPPGPGPTHGARPAVAVPRAPGHQHQPQILGRWHGRVRGLLPPVWGGPCC